MTLFEVLVVLAILAMMTGLAFGLRRGPSPALELERQATVLVERAARLRQNAIAANAPQDIVFEDAGCGETDAHFIFYPNGTASGGDICLRLEDRQLRLKLDRLTGLLVRIEP